MNEKKYNELKTNIKKIFKDNTEIAKGIKNMIDAFSENCQATKQDVLFVTMKEFTKEYQASSVLQFYHYLGNIKRDEVVNMINFLELCRQKEV
ncbi:TPA: hypothetical protein PQC92_002970 [Staphylococcus aureus]|uniref:Phage protein n=2 Tax=Staphylococcus TaxID=1279 RepID=A0A380G0B1_9STAP|nr:MULTISPECIES: hypothetical protein [Staphylococcus]EHS75580.1 hypothetical protein IS189_2261 [Staphylococcus aureus subsp. aureus IS-189]AID40690.1 hypothetical protein SAXN108_2249 [Staphylococcus aureus]AND36814.1 hypothetical protein ASL17_12005 [Staphylococcus aureus]AND45478.1 hypothetical protein ASL18_12000 [Staphylococcus aureus]ARI74475.1 hypothetical protein A6V38_12115 [Staphylococcus aureus]